MTIEIFGELFAAAIATVMLWLTVNLDKLTKEK